MITSLPARLLSVPESPTADLYFGNSCRGMAGVRQLAPTVFATDHACLVMRHPLRAGPLPRGKRLVYLLDDDVVAGAGDASLPPLYRRRLGLVEARMARRMAAEADEMVVTVPGLGRPGAHIIGPHWSEPFAPLDHFEGAEAGGQIEMAFLGSRTHRADLAFLWPVVQRLLAGHPRLRFHLPEGHRRPVWARAHPRVAALPARGWCSYRRGLAGRRFHLALYPLLDTPFNARRSLNKLIEHAVVGAAPLYSDSWGEGARVAHGFSGLRLPNDPAVWEAAITALVTEPARMSPLATGAQALAAGLNRPEPQQRLWSRLLGPEGVA